MARAFEESHAAYARKDGAAAKELSNEGKAYQKEMDRLNAEACAWIFRGEYFCPFPPSLPSPTRSNFYDSRHAFSLSYRREQSCEDNFPVLADFYSFE